MISTRESVCVPRRDRCENISRQVNLMKTMKLHCLAVVVTVLAAAPVMAQRNNQNTMVLRGKVREIKFVSNDPNYV